MKDYSQFLLSLFGAYSSYFFTFFVSFLSGEAAIQEKELDEKQKEANDALIMIKETMQNASQQKTQMQDLRGEMTFLFVYTTLLSFCLFFSVFAEFAFLSKQLFVYIVPFLFVRSNIARRKRYQCQEKGD